MRRGRRKLVVGGVAVLCLLLGGAGLAMAPATTKQGVNFRVSSRAIPLYAKALGFLYRDAQYRLLADEATREAQTDEGRAVAVFEWTRQRIRQTPPGWPIVDDHILDIIVRGYGEDDQMADVFATVATYAGLPAFWRVAKVSGGRLVLAFARVDGRWTMVDVAHGLMFTGAGGRLADVHALIADPTLVRAVAGALAPEGVAYAQYVAQLHPFRVPEVLRAAHQMPWPRLLFEVKRLVAVR